MDNQYVQPAPPVDPETPASVDQANAATIPNVQSVSLGNQPPMPTLAKQPAPPPRKGLFDHVLTALNGGPTQVQNPQTGQVEEVPMNKKSLTSHLLAGVLTGIIQGAQAKGDPNDPTRNSQNMTALGAGAQGTQDKLKEIRQKPQAQMDEQQARAYNTLKRNIDTHGAMLTLGNSTAEAQATAEKPGMDMWKQAQAADETADPTQPKIILNNTPVTADELMKKFNMSANNALMVGHQAMLNPDGSQKMDPSTGKPYMEPIFVPINPAAKLPMSPEMKAQFGKDEPAVNRLPDNTPVGVGWYLDRYNNHINLTTAADSMSAAAKQVASVTGSKEEPKDFTKIIQSDPVLRKNAALIGQYFGHGNTVMDAISKMSKDSEAKGSHIDPQVISRISKALGLDQVDAKGKTVSERMALKAQDDLQKQKDAQELEKRKADDKERRNLAFAEKLDAQNIKNRGLDAASSNTTTFPNQWTDPKLHTNYDLSHPAMKLVDGTLAPQELSKRATKGSDSYNNIIKAADDYSLARYGKNFDFQKADNDWKYATQKGTQDTFKFLNSLTGRDNQSGNLGDLIKKSDSITRTDFPAINDKLAWARINAGDPSMAGYLTNVTEVADQVAKVLQGGGTGSGTSDTKLKQAQEMFRNGWSKDSMREVATTLRQLLGNRKSEMIGDNRYLQKQYGHGDTLNQPRTPPPGKFAAKDAQGNIIGYADDNKGTGFVRF